MRNHREVRMICIKGLSLVYCAAGGCCRSGSVGRARGCSNTPSAGRMGVSEHPCVLISFVIEW